MWKTVVKSGLKEGRPADVVSQSDSDSDSCGNVDIVSISDNG